MHDCFGRFYSFVIPTRHGLEEIMKFSPKFIDVGAGFGYWSMLLKNMGCEVKAIDTQPDEWWFYDGVEKVSAEKYFQLSLDSNDSALLYVSYPGVHSGVLQDLGGLIANF
eukprot:TRINITY_DN4833_c0_g1_i1.p1 TRINITY_DN4833_c0_g1~~TRINITY_DN4833_c0_g1_i1.p1  ORF type:complete len:123 (-),score=27.17 TRINITY_DN4833_c0_g1_i1:210-539(-)